MTDFLAEYDFLHTPTEKIVGKKSSEKLKKLGVENLLDLLHFAPRKYHRLGELTDFEQLKEDEYVTVVARVVNVTQKPLRGKRTSLLQVVLADEANRYLTATLFVSGSRGVFFHKRNLTIGAKVLFSGKITQFNSVKQLSNPEYEVIQELDDDKLLEHIQKPVPIYRATEGFASWKVATCVKTALNLVASYDLPEVLPEEIRLKYNLLDYMQALEKLHEPATEEDYRQALRTLKFQEAYMLLYVMAFRKASFMRNKTVALHEPLSNHAQKLRESLPFQLTTAQERVIAEISADMASAVPMNRMLMGDVGSGKTIVALLSMLQAVDCGYQAILLAPTEVLAKQHYESICESLGSDLATATDIAGEKVKVELLTGSISAAQKKKVMLDLTVGTAGIYVGTHALLSQKIQPSKLGLLVVDEQHRFGVRQRQYLRDVSELTPHTLLMTATPIPRSVAISIFGDLDMSIIDSKPAGRLPIKTFLVDPNKKYMQNGVYKTWSDRLWEKVREEVDKGNCAYVVVPKIGVQEQDLDYVAPDDVETEQQEAKQDLEQASLTKVVEQLRANPIFEGIGINSLSSRTSAEEKSQIISQFQSGKAPILVSTTVIEVGVDVKNATMMVILDAHQFGYATLHQLRGRVGRNDKQSYCMLVSSVDTSHISYNKLDSFSKTSDGFEVAELDLKMRKEGDILGDRQSGIATSLKFLNIISDIELIEEVKKVVQALSADTQTMLDSDYMDTVSVFYGQQDTQYLQQG